ncbi:helix-turn-helix domain-containing protein [Streptomyces cathayae]|uniref:helix-turn-helix domain-containing protein n=1 Tax=Streptomyces cathayae TaxID=3031124 RepID=UPI003C6EFC6F
MAVRRPLTREEREEIAVGRAQGEGVREIARRVGRCSSVVSREPHATPRRAATGHRRPTSGRRRGVGGLSNACWTTTCCCGSGSWPTCGTGARRTRSRAV